MDITSLNLPPNQKSGLVERRVEGQTRGLICPLLVFQWNNIRSDSIESRPFPPRSQTKDRKSLKCPSQSLYPPSLVQNQQNLSSFSVLVSRAIIYSGDSRLSGKVTLSHLTYWKDLSEPVFSVHPSIPIYSGSRVLRPRFKRILLIECTTRLRVRGFQGKSSKDSGVLLYRDHVCSLHEPGVGEGDGMSSNGT